MAAKRTPDGEPNGPSPAAQLTHPAYRPDIDGLRAVAVLSVVAFHAFPASVKGGFIGVDLFFVISGFLISTIIFGSLERGAFSFAEFYRRRIRRIFPSLFVVLIACFMLGWFSLLANEYQQLGKHIAAGAAFASNLVLWNESGYFDQAAETKPLLHLWSLGIEEQFYIMWPLLLWVGRKFRFNLLTVTLALAAVSFSLNLATFRVNGVADFYSPLTRFWELLAGSILAYAGLHGGHFRNAFNAALKRLPGTALAARVQQHHRVTIRNVQSLLGAVFIASSVFLITKDTPFPGTWALLPVTGTMLVIAAGQGAWINRAVLSNRLLVWFGLISYPLYLWHWPLLSFARIFEEAAPRLFVRLLLVSAAIALAWATTTFIERPLRFGKASNIAPPLLFASMTLVALLGAVTFSQSGFLSRAVVAKNLNSDPDIGMEANPMEGCSIPNISQYVACTVNKSTVSRGTILIWGDSTAGVWLPPFLDIAKKDDLSVIRIEHQSCSPLLGIRKTRFAMPESRYFCDVDTKRRIYDFIRSTKPDLIFVMAAWNVYSHYPTTEFITDGDEGEADATTTARAIRSKVPYTLGRLLEIAPVVVIRPWPFLSVAPVYNVRRLDFLTSVKDYVTTPVEEYEKESALINSVFETMDEKVAFFDPASMICDSARCSTVYGNVKLYYDDYHVTKQGAMAFRPQLETLIHQMLPAKR